MSVIDRFKSDPNIAPAFRDALPDQIADMPASPSPGSPIAAPAPRATLCDFTVAAASACPVIIASAHALYFWRSREGVKEFEIEQVRDAMRKLNEAFAVVEAMFAPGEAVQREVAAIKADMRRGAPAGHTDAFADACQAECQADYDDERRDGWAV